MKLPKDLQKKNMKRKTNNKFMDFIENHYIDE